MPVNSMVEEKPLCRYCDSENVTYWVKETGTNSEVKYACRRHLTSVIDNCLRAATVRNLKP